MSNVRRLLVLVRTALAVGILQALFSTGALAEEARHQFPPLQHPFMAEATNFQHTVLTQAFPLTRVSFHENQSPEIFAESRGREMTRLCRVSIDLKTVVFPLTASGMVTKIYGDGRMPYNAIASMR